MAHQNLLPTILRLTTMMTTASDTRTEVLNYLRNETIQRMKDEVNSDIKDKMVPEDIGSFSELHDSVDANEYGGFCEDALCDAFIALFGGRDEHEGMPNAFLKFMDECQCAVDEWLKNGRV